MLGWELPPHNSGGLGVACFQMSKALAQARASIEFIVPYKAEHPDAHFMTVLHATELSPLHSYGMGAYDPITETIETADDPSSVNDSVSSLRGIQKRYIRYIKQKLNADHDFDAIHAHDWLTLEAGMMAKEIMNVPLIAHVHATEFDRAGQQYGNPLVHEIEQQGLQMADRIIAY